MLLRAPLLPPWGSPPATARSGAAHPGRQRGLLATLPSSAGPGVRCPGVPRRGLWGALGRCRSAWCTGVRMPRAREGMRDIPGRSPGCLGVRGSWGKMRNAPGVFRAGERLRCALGKDGECPGKGTECPGKGAGRPGMPRARERCGVPGGAPGQGGGAGRAQPVTGAPRVQRPVAPFAEEEEEEEGRVKPGAASFEIRT